MKINTNLYGFVYKRSNGKYTTFPYLRSGYSNPTDVRSQMVGNSRKLKRSLKDMKVVRFVLETVD